MDLTISEKILIIIKSFGIIGRELVKKSEITDAYILLQDVFFDSIDKIDRINPREIEIQIVDGTITMLKKIGLLEKNINGYILTKKGDIFITNKLSSSDSINYLKASLEIASLPEIQRHLFALLVALKHDKALKAQQKTAEHLEKSYQSLKNELKNKTLKSMLNGDSQA